MILCLSQTYNTLGIVGKAGRTKTDLKIAIKN